MHVVSPNMDKTFGFALAMKLRYDWSTCLPLTFALYLVDNEITVIFYAIQ